MQLSVSPEIGKIIDASAAISARKADSYVGIEHLFQALVDQSSLLPPIVTDKHLTSLHTVCREVERQQWRGKMAHLSTDQFYTPRCANLINEASRLAKRLGSNQAGATHLFLAVIADAHSLPSRIMDQLGMGRGELISAIHDSLAGGRGKSAPTGARATSAGAAPAAASKQAASVQQGLAQSEETEKKASNEAVFQSLTKDLTEAARRKEIEPAIGRDKETYMLLEVLARKSKNNVILVGDAGVGKTKVVEGLAVAIAEGKLSEEFSRFKIVELNIASLMSGTQYRGVFEEKVTDILEKLKQSKDTVLFIDEIHLIMGSGSTGDGSMDLANLLKPALGRGEIRCIGATTIAEYRKFIEKDPAIERRFQMLRVEAMSDAATYAVLKNMRPSYEQHHCVKIDKAALKAAISLTQQYMPNRNLPDKAIDILDQACARHRLKQMKGLNRGVSSASESVLVDPETVTPHDIRRVVSQATGIPLEEITADERVRLGNIERKIAKEIIGQDSAITKVVSAVKRSRAGLADPNRPDSVLLFLGPTGVGKTQLAKALASHVFGSSSHLLTFDMSEYVEEHSVSKLLGAPPGYIGHDEEGRLSSAVRNKPFAVLLFDEIEKAHPRIFDIFLPILDEGRTKDTRGREVSFKNCMIIFTSNIGAQSLDRSDVNAESHDLMTELQGHFRPEFINRIDEIVPFYPLLFEDIREILKLSLRALRIRLRERGLDVHVYQKAYEYLAEQGYSPKFGARELRRCVERLIVNPISALLLKEQFQHGEIIEVRMEGGSLDFKKAAAPAPGAKENPL